MTPEQRIEFDEYLESRAATSGFSPLYGTDELILEKIVVCLLCEFIWGVVNSAFITTTIICPECLRSTGLSIEMYRTKQDQ